MTGFYTYKCFFFANIVSFKILIKIQNIYNFEIYKFLSHKTAELLCFCLQWNTDKLHTKIQGKILTTSDWTMCLHTINTYFFMVYDIMSRNVKICKIIMNRKYRNSSNCQFGINIKELYVTQSSNETAFLSTWPAHKINKRLHLRIQSVSHSWGVNLKLSNTTLCQHWSQNLLNLNRGWCYRISNHLIRQGCGHLLTLMVNLKQEAASIHQSCQVTMAAVVREVRWGVGSSLRTCFWTRRSRRDASPQPHTAQLQPKSSLLHG